MREELLLMLKENLQAIKEEKLCLQRENKAVEAFKG